MNAHEETSISQVVCFPVRRFSEYKIMLPLKGNYYRIFLMISKKVDYLFTKKLFSSVARRRTRRPDGKSKES
jgi:hypothetical protein